MSVPTGADSIECALGRYADMVFRIAYHNVKTREDAEDITQEVFIKLISSGKSFTSPEHEKAWLIRVTVNKCHDFLRAQHRGGAALPYGADDKKDNVSGMEVFDAVMRLPAKYGSTVYLYYYEGFTVPEIARMLRRKKSTVSSWLCRARVQLKDSLSGGLDGE